MEVPQHVRRKTKSTRPSKKSAPQIIKDISSPYISKVGTHRFTNGHEVGLFEVSDYRALNQLIGYAKFLNTDYGDVYYRGEVELHNTLLPSISRKAGCANYERVLNDVIDKTLHDTRFAKTAKLTGFKGRHNPRLVAEAMLQHYGYSTHFIDLVDNHWIALWFGLNKYRTIKNLSEYCLYEKRVVNPIELLDADEDAKNEIYQYMILVAVDNNAAPVERGIYIGNDIITIDLRSSLPSIFLRPHAQHGLVVRKNTHQTGDSFDVASNVIAVVRLRIDNVSAWIGEGSLLSNQNLFPSPAYDYGYELLLQRSDLFASDYQRIAQYV